MTPTLCPSSGVNVVPIGRAFPLAPSASLKRCVFQHCPSPSPFGSPPAQVTEIPLGAQYRITKRKGQVDEDRGVVFAAIERVAEQ